jgi:hypothetical protein
MSAMLGVVDGKKGRQVMTPCKTTMESIAFLAVLQRTYVHCIWSYSHRTPRESERSWSNSGAGSAMWFTLL